MMTWTNGLEKAQQDIKFSATSIGNFGLKEHKSWLDDKYSKFLD
jgi:hypothetical protein